MLLLIKKTTIMEFEKKTAAELEAIKQRELQEFADAEQRAKARGEHQTDVNSLDPSSEVEPSQAGKFHQQHGNRKYSMFKNESASDNMPSTRTDTI